MKACAYCGQDMPEPDVCCGQCGAEQLMPDKDWVLQFPESVSLQGPPLVDLTTIPGAFRYEEEFSRPEWGLIQAKVEEQVNPVEHHQAWTEIAIQWLLKLREELGGDYHVTESSEFLLLCGLDRGDTQRVLQFAENTILCIRAQLQEVAWKGFIGKHVILLFTDDDDFHQYRAAFLQEGLNVAAAGFLSSQGYIHIAMPYQGGVNVRVVLAHELAHNCLAHLPIPLWLNEGVALRVDRLASHSRDPILNPELADQHRSFWTESNIQWFWAGVSFHDPEAQTLSYSLAEIVVQLLAGNHQGFLEFLRHAHYSDAGQTAALDCLGVNLGDVLAEFLGPGNWRPYRRAMVDCWKVGENPD